MYTLVNNDQLCTNWEEEEEEEEDGRTDGRTDGREKDKQN